jgi:hypothetical protein
MGFYDGPSIVTNGLVLSVDAADKNSYPGSGTVWSDLSGNLYSGILTNSPTFNSANGGSLVFNGTNQYVTGSGPSSFDLSTNQNYSICTWINPTFADTSATTSAIFNYSGPGTSFLRTYLRWEGTSLGFYLDTTDTNIIGSAWRFKPTFAANTWNCLCFTHTSANTGLYYFNGISYAPTIAASGVKTGVTGFAATIGYGSVNSYYFNGKIATTQIYNLALSANEIFQNYIAQKSRFGL